MLNPLAKIGYQVEIWDFAFSIFLSFFTTLVFTNSYILEISSNFKQHKEIFGDKTFANKR